MPGRESTAKTRAKLREFELYTVYSSTIIISIANTTTLYIKQYILRATNG